MKLIIIGNKKNIIINMLMNIFIIILIIFLTFYLMMYVNIKVSKGNVDHRNSTYVNKIQVESNTNRKSLTDLIQIRMKNKRQNFRK